jgi:hypothetical protein
MPGLPVYLSYPPTAPTDIVGAVADPALDGYASLPSREAYLAYMVRGRDGEGDMFEHHGTAQKKLSHSKRSFRWGWWSGTQKVRKPSSSPLQGR